jgi:prepilin-type N-terminal cleavage/methylation domain-containing protein
MIRGVTYHRRLRAFTLIELLTVLAVMAVLLGLLVPVLNQARLVSRRIGCQGRLQQMAVAWDLYLHDSDQVFYQNVNANHDFGGWPGMGHLAQNRVLNPYLGLPGTVATAVQARAFQCPSDQGGILGRPSTQQAFEYFGNSYQTNLFLIGPDQSGIPPNELAPLHEQLNLRLKRLTRTQVNNPSLLILVGDNPWVNQWMPGIPERVGWHGPGDRHAVAFLDGHTDFIPIVKGMYVTRQYTILPFKSLYPLAYELQPAMRP